MPDYSKFEDQIFFMTVFFENLTDQESGTAFLVRKPIEGNMSKILMFSNKHVFFGKEGRGHDLERQGRITLHRKNDNDEIDVRTRHTFTFNYSSTSEAVILHPEDTVDVACINISDLFSQIPLSSKYMNLEDFIDTDVSEFVAGEEILFVGYPSGFFDRSNYLPVLRKGHFASMPSVDFNDKPQLLIDAEVFPGSSGSPVYAVHKGHYKFVGIISEAAISKLSSIEVPISGSQQTSQPTVQIPIQYLGLGIMFKPITVKQVFDLA